MGRPNTHREMHGACKNLRWLHTVGSLQALVAVFGNHPHGRQKRFVWQARVQ